MPTALSAAQGMPTSQARGPPPEVLVGPLSESWPPTMGHFEAVWALWSLACSYVSQMRSLLPHLTLRLVLGFGAWIILSPEVWVGVPEPLRI